MEGEIQNQNQIDNTLVKMILKSITEGDLNLIKSYIQKYNLDMKLLIDNENQQNAFFNTTIIKSDEKALEMCKYFKEIGIDPLFKDKHQQTCLYYAAREGKLLTCKFLVEECNVPINEKDIYGQNPIYYSCREGHLDVCKYLVEKGSDINLEDKYGQTCVFYAIKQGHYDVVDFLIKNGLNVNKIDKRKQTPVSFAEKMNQIKIMELLIQNGGIKGESKNKNDNKNKGKRNKKTSEEGFINKEDMINSIQRPKKNILVKVNENGEKNPLSKEEIEEFKKKYPQVSKLLFEKDELEKEKKLMNQDLLLYENWEKNAKKLLSLLWKVKDADLFHKPVDPEELGLPNYLEIVKNPMDFSTIKKKLNNFCYSNFKEFCNDMNLVFDNCYLFNGKDSNVGNMCTNVKNQYEKLYQQLDMEKFL